MNSFTHPSLLMLLVIPVLLIARVWIRKGREIAVPFDFGLPKQGVFIRSTINLAECLPALLLGIVIIILAGPQRLGEPKTIRKMTNIEFCVDISGSMNAQMGSGTRYDASMQAINDFLDFRQGDAFGLTFFGNSVLHWVPLTTDTSAFRCAPPFMRPGRVPRWFGGTEIGKALLACKEVLASRDEGDRMIVLISDGSSSDLSAGNDVEIARKLRHSEITVYAIHIAESSIPEPIVNITSITGGEVFAAGDPNALQAVFARIDGMQDTEQEKIAAETLDHFAPFCAIGLGILSACVVALLGLRYTPW